VGAEEEGVSAWPQVPWPDGARCAACISWDVDADTLVLHSQQGRGHELYGSLSWLRYDEVGIARICEAFAEYGLRQTFFVCAWCIERHPEMCAPIVEGDHEIGHHGYTHEAPNGLTPEGELHELRRGIELIESFTGRRPTGWRAPYAAQSAHSAAYLVEHGFTYDSSLMNDSVPYLIEAGGGQLVELPFDGSMSDWPHYAHVPDLGYVQSPKAPSTAMEAFREEFDAVHELGGLWLTIWHPHVSARPARLLAWKRLVEYMLDKGGVWFATLDEIARHVQACIEDGSYRPRTVRLPWYGATPPEFGVAAAHRRPAG
jgi:peptidoglycan/xylan/chitin deacetylase (PgdA/CDA1 family)